VRVAVRVRVVVRVFVTVRVFERVYVGVWVGVCERVLVGVAVNITRVVLLVGVSDGITVIVLSTVRVGIAVLLDVGVLVMSVPVAVSVANRNPCCAAEVAIAASSPDPYGTTICVLVGVPVIDGVTLIVNVADAVIVVVTK